MHGLLPLVAAPMRGVGRPAGRMSRTAVGRRRAVVCRGGAMMRLRRAVMLGRDVMVAGGPAMARLCSRHRREGRRFGLRLRGFGGRLSSRRRFTRTRLLDDGQRLPGWHRLRSYGRCKNRESQGCGGKNGRLHHILPSPPDELEPGGPDPRIDGDFLTGTSFLRGFTRGLARSGVNIGAPASRDCRRCVVGIGRRA